MRLAYLTDVEGQWQRIETFCANNPLVSLVDGHLLLAEGASFVFGGDAIDRGPHSRRIVALLSAAKRRYAERVVLLAGNRDINKLRLGRELAGQPPKGVPDAIRAEGDAALLRWIFERTMGAPGAFEHRRSELVAEGNMVVSDADVVGSFVLDVAPDGALSEYLALCQLAYRDGRTLFVHGGVSEGSLGKIPSSDGFRTAADLDEWASQLNDWYRAQVEAYRSDSQRSDSAPQWQPLIDYQAPAAGQRNNPNSVVYTRHADTDNDPRLPARKLVDKLLDAGIHRVVAGHMPTGDTPALLRDRERAFELLLADNSYSRTGNASRVLLDDHVVQIEGEVVLDDTSQFTIQFSVAPEDVSSPVGLRLATGELVKAPLADGRYLTFKALPNYQVQQQAVSATTWRSEELEAPYP